MLLDKNKWLGILIKVSINQLHIVHLNLSPFYINTIMTLLHTPITQIFFHIFVLFAVSIFNVNFSGTCTHALTHTHKSDILSVAAGQ